MTEKSTPTETMTTTPVAADVAQRRLETLLTIGEEVITTPDLHSLLLNKPEFRLYDGFEPSGRMHIAQGVFKAINVNKCIANGGTFVFWVADWFALMNDKMGGDLDKIRTVGQYFVEVWRAAGMDLSSNRVEFRWASDSIIGDASAYWSLVLDVAKRFTCARIMKCCTIMGRAEGSLTAAQMLYPLMQCSDVFFLKADICQLGLDQRKVNMLAREYCDSKGIKRKPVILSHHMLLGLKQGQAKMSKSDPDSAVFMEDSKEDIERKISNAYCPKEDNAAGNPCLDYVKNICLSPKDAVFFAGGKEYKSADEVRDDYVSGNLSEKELKDGLAKSLEGFVGPVRKHFTEDEDAKRLLELVQQYKKESTHAKAENFVTAKIKDVSVRNGVMISLPIVTSLKLSLSVVLSVISAVNSTTAEQICLVIPDLSTVLHNAYAADRKTDCNTVIASAYNAIIIAVRAISSKQITMINQSELMHNDPSGYWISAINAGRFFSLGDVQSALSTEEGSSSPVGPVVAFLLRVADILALSPRNIVSIGEDEDKLNQLALKYITAREKHVRVIPDVEVSVLVNTELQESDAKEDDLLLDDKFAPEVKKKIKRAFCEPGNASFNPPLTLAVWCLDVLKKTATIDGKNYDEGVVMVADYKSGVIHPKDLKECVTSLLGEVYGSMEKALSGSKDVATFKKYATKITKRK